MKDFEMMTPEEQRLRMKELYEKRNEGIGSNVRFMDDLEHMFVTEDCGGDMNFRIYDRRTGHVGFASLQPDEVVRLVQILQDRVRDYPTHLKSKVINPFQIRVLTNPNPRPW